MAQYRKKPVVIEAVQWQGWNTPEVVEFSKSEDINKTHPTWFFHHDGTLSIRTLEGEMKADKGDWIIKEPFPTGNRKFYPCKNDIFEATYEAVV